MPDSAVVAALLAGLLGGLHCVAMCGAYVALVDAGAVRTLRPARAIAADRAAAHAGRLASYVVLGAAFGALGGAALAGGWPSMQRGLYIAANVALLALAWALATGRGAPAFAERIGVGLHTLVAPAARGAIAGRGIASRLLLGAVWGLTPCALVWSVLPLALFAGGAWQGALVMFAFGLGTLPNLLVAGSLIARLRDRVDATLARRVAAGIVAVLACVGLWRALGADGALPDTPYCIVR